MITFVETHAPNLLGTAEYLIILAAGTVSAALVVYASLREPRR